jgi:mannose-1-phosphate guanylyltransferase/phosphomannomutase
MTTDMKAILFADRNGSELQPLTNKTSVALLPIAAKPLIEYTLDALLETGIREVIVVISTFAKEIKRLLGNGERWGMQFEYVQSTEQPATLLTRLATKLSDSKYLLVRGDVLRSLNIKAFLEQALQQEKEQILATIDGYNAGVCLLKIPPNPEILPNPKIPPNLEEFEESERVHALALTGNLSWLDSLKAYHQANLAVLAGHFPSLVLPVRQINDKLQVGCRSSVPKGNAGLVGAFCRVHKKAALLGDVVLCDEVIVDRYAKLSATVVLHGTYIGEAVELQNAIVWGNMLIQIDTGAVEHVDDKLLLADLKTKNFNAFFRKAA